MLKLKCIFKLSRIRDAARNIVAIYFLFSSKSEININKVPSKVRDKPVLHTPISFQYWYFHHVSKKNFKLPSNCPVKSTNIRIALKCVLMQDFAEDRLNVWLNRPMIHASAGLVNKNKKSYLNGFFRFCLPTRDTGIIVLVLC